MNNSRNSLFITLALSLVPVLITLAGCEDGQDGAQGPAGPPGSAGPVGSTGATGATGAQGPKGDKGDKGDPGQDGQDGTDGSGGNSGSGGSGGHDNNDTTLYSWDLYSGEGVYDNDLKPSDLWSSVKSNFANNSSNRKFYNLSSGNPPNWNLEKFSGKQGGYMLYKASGHPTDFMLSAPGGALFGKTYYTGNGESMTDSFWGVSNITYSWDSDDRCPCWTVFIAQQSFTMGSAPYAYMLPGQPGTPAVPVELTPFINPSVEQAWFNPAMKGNNN